ncbi:MAG: InlB B-repeat-containing protein, partial [Clostridiales bacterium]|nr:InlB B-repeat-containing protein [Clostridiales bacterium]
MKRWIAMLLTVCMLISLCPVGVFAEPATGGTEPAQTVQTKQSATGATGEEPAAAPENKEEPTPASEGAENPPAAPAPEGNKNVPAENGGENTPAPEGNGNVPADNGGATGTTGVEPAAAPENKEEPTPAPEDAKNPPAAAAPEGNKNVPAENGGENTPAPEGNGNVPADNGGATGATGEQNPQPEQKTCTCTKLCAQDAPNTDCKVCKDGDVTNCKGSLAALDDPESLPDDQPVVAEPEEPVCTCTAHCTADNVDQNCKACKKDVSKCHGSETQPVVDIYEFYVDGVLQEDWTQNLQDGEYLSVPGNPAKEGAVFQRWYRLDDAQNRITVEGGTVSGVSGKTVKVYAEFAEFSYVLFMSADGNAVVHTAQGSKGNTVDASDRKAAAEMVNLSLDPTQAVVGWSPTKGAAADETISFAAGTVNVYPVIKTGYWVTFDSKGGDYVAPIFAQDGETVSLPGAARLGYTFGGWYLGEQRVESVSAAATLEANWIAKEDTQYTVIHWQENANDNEYSFKKSETKTGKTGEQTDAKAKSYEGFTAQTVEQQTIAGDGSTIVNVYYRRNVYTITFYLDAPLYDCGKEAHRHSVWNGCYDLGGLICKKTEHTHTSACGSSVNQLKITAKYGANISKQWPTVYGSNTWRTSKNGSTYQVNIDVMPLNGKSFYGPKTADSSETAYYYVEVLPGETGTISKGGISYKLHHSDTSPGTGYSVTKEDRYPITGFTFAGGTDIGEDYNNARFYYTRNSYNIVFINKGNTEDTKSLKFDQPLDGVNHVPSHPANVPASYEFAGWYDNEAGEGNAFVFEGKTMPAQNITLYAKWKAPEISATVYLTVEVNGESRKLSVPYGSSLKEAEGYEQLMEEVKASNGGNEPSAWFSVDGDGAKTLFNPDTKLYAPVTLVPHFSGTLDTFKVTYIEKDTLDGPVDSNVYQSGSYATVLSPIHGNLRFLYWKDGNGKVYKPGQSIKMTGDVTLTAYYTEAPAASTLTYHSGDKSIVRSGLTS